MWMLANDYSGMKSYHEPDMIEIIIRKSAVSGNLAD